MTATPPTDTLSPTDTVTSIRDAAAVQWWQVTSLIALAGPDAISLLDGLCTQAIERCTPGTSTDGLLLDAKAKIIAPLTIHCAAPRDWQNPRADDVVTNAPMLLLETLPHLVDPTIAHLRRYRLRSRATIEPVTDTSVALIGARATSYQAQLEGEGRTICATINRAIPKLTIIASPATCHELVSAELQRLGLGLAHPQAAESARIDAGIASLHDFAVGRMPAEVGALPAAVALDKGCYLGQEPVARLHYRGRANRTLRMVEGAPGAQIIPAIDSDDDAADGLALVQHADQADISRSIGTITTWSERADGSLTALAIIRRELEVGDAVTCRWLVGTDSLRIGSPVALPVAEAATPSNPQNS
jgi:folate-binding protein YgfZ